MAFLIPAGLLIIGLICCIGIAFLVVQARAEERKNAVQKALVTTQKNSARPATPKTTVVPATPVPSTPSVLSTSSAPSTEPVNDATTKKPVSEAALEQTQEKTTDTATSTFETKDVQENAQHANGHVELENGQLYAEIEQVAQFLQEGKLSPEWVREQIQELSVKVQDMHQQSALVERHIALLSQIALYMNELEQVRHEYKVLRERRGAVLRIPTHLQGEGEDGDTYIHTDKRPAMRKYTLKTL